MIIFFLLTALFATVAVTIAAGMTVLLVYLWRKYVIALRVLQVLNNAYQSVLLEQTLAAPMRAQQSPEPEKPLLFVAKNYHTMH